MSSRILLIDLAGASLQDLRGTLAAGAHNVLELPARWRIAECGRESGADIVIARVGAETDLRKALAGSLPATPTATAQALPAVLLVGPPDSARRGEALELGAEDWLAEGLAPGYLLDRINNILRRRAGQHSGTPQPSGLREPERAFAGKAAFWISPAPQGATLEMISRLARHAGVLSTAAAPAAHSLAIVLDGPGWRVPATAPFLFVTRQPFGDAARFALRCGALDVIDGAAGEQEVLMRLTRAWQRHSLARHAAGPVPEAGGPRTGATQPKDAQTGQTSGRRGSVSGV